MDNDAPSSIFIVHINADLSVYSTKDLASLRFCSSGMGSGSSICDICCNWSAEHQCDICKKNLCKKCNKGHWKYHALGVLSDVLIGILDLILS